MKTTCPHCTQHISIDPETLAELQTQEHFQCPACGGLVPVPPLSGTMPVAPVRTDVDTAAFQATPSPAPATILAQAHRGLNRNLLILGSVALLVLGGLGFFLASRGGNIFNSEQKITKQIINNSYFQNLIASGTTTQEDLETIAVIRPYEDGFIGVSKEPFTWTKAEDFAKLIGGEILNPNLGGLQAQGDLTRWLGDTFGSHLVVPAWVQESGEARILEGSEMLAVNDKTRERRVLVQWRARFPMPGNLREGLVLHYRFDTDETSSKVKDSSDMKNHGKPSGVQWTADGKRDGAYEFAADGHEITVENNPSLNPARITLAAWIKTNHSDHVWRRIFDKSYREGYALSVIGDWKQENWHGLGGLETGPDITFGHTKRKLTDGQWHHLAATFDGTEHRLYVDGEPDGKSLDRLEPKQLQSTDFNLVIGCNRSNRSSEEDDLGQSFRGIIDEPMIWNRTLSPEEVRQLFESFR